MAKNKSQYDSTLNLPKTLFEMRAGLPKKEPVMLKDWDDNDLYNQLMKHNEGKPQFILHDGPPYANGNIHMGTALNKIIKDIIIREKNMEGFQAPYVPGFDTHGLPIELKALSSVGEKKKDISKLELRQICEKFATEHIDIMSDQFKRLGVIGDFEHPYLTLKPEFEARQIEIFGEMAKKGYIYKGLKPVYWCPDCRTALAEAEIEYGEDECDSIFVRFHVSQDPNGVLAKHGIPMEKTYFVIWTTTTWTLPANEAICLNGQFEYSFVKIGDEFHIMATDLVKSVMDACHITDYEVVGEPVSGAEFELMRYNHVYLPKEGWVILGDHVTLESGSGCVHTAGGHGVDDFNVCQKYPQIPITVPVDDGGYLTEQAGKYAGQRVWASNKTILADLTAAGAVMGQLHIKHQYPHCWRCHNPIIFRATEQWFCSIAKFREDVYKAIDTVTWMPDWGHDRMHGMVRDRNDWCISRQRTWGVPIPAFYCKKCGAYHITDATIKAVSDLFRKEGSDAWYKYDAEQIIPAGEVCEKCGASEWTKDTDIMDVWFDSGSTHAAVLEERPELRFPADLYMEGGDQFRGWFQSSLLTSVASKGCAPYKSVLCHGWVVVHIKIITMKKNFLAVLFALALCSPTFAQWKPAGDKIKTPWGEQLNPKNVLPEYPRPIMERQDWKNLNGSWNYAITKKGEPAPNNYQGEILVPFAVESSLSGVGKTINEHQELWYQRTFDVPSAWKGKQILLHFGAVDWKADVWVNDVKVGQHTGGFTPFYFDITSALNKGNNQLVVKVWDPSDRGEQPRGKQVERPEGIWYTPVTGIWQTVWLEPVAAQHIAQLKTTPDIDKKTVKVEVATNVCSPDKVEVKVFDGKNLVAKGAALNGVPVELTMPEDVKLWTPESPSLYNMEVTLYKDGKAVDQVKSYTALRKFSTHKDKNGITRLQLNNKDYFQFGPLDQGWWPDGLYTAPTDEALVYDLKKIKDFGYNMVRKHVKVEPARWYTYCDQLGLIVWQDMPNGGRGPAEWQMHKYYDGADAIRSAASEANYRKEWKEIIDYLYSYPSIGVWVS